MEPTKREWAVLICDQMEQMGASQDFENWLTMQDRAFLMASAQSLLGWMKLCVKWLAENGDPISQKALKEMEFKDAEFKIKEEPKKPRFHFDN